ncbi:PREDICTED: uncharacterized protein LOC104725073 [Camelina sativa]|uniref:Uncharacterized protein LOC104725073 n=1 Tax=Camelina sativa TaxID=90675 RepID=A0ABM0UJA6_CAMSA|nr:PREDICTED: uncharacterized protein LOC104725073 [Camelina sativa]
MVLETVQSAEGGHLFYKCENYFDGGLHLIKSWEKAVVDEIHDLQVKNYEHEDRIAYLTRGPDGECVEPSMQWAELKFLGEEMKELQQLVRSILYTERMEELVGNSSGAQSSSRWTNNIINVAIAFLLFVLLLTMVYSAFK